jgi:hypothetical protein
MSMWKCWLYGLDPNSISHSKVSTTSISQIQNKIQSRIWGKDRYLIKEGWKNPKVTENENWLII